MKENWGPFYFSCLSVQKRKLRQLNDSLQDPYADENVEPLASLWMGISASTSFCCRVNKNRGLEMGVQDCVDVWGRRCVYSLEEEWMYF